MESATFQLLPVSSIIGCNTHSFPDIFGNVAVENAVQPLCPGNGDVIGCQMPWEDKTGTLGMSFTQNPNSYNQKLLTSGINGLSTLFQPCFIHGGQRTLTTKSSLQQSQSLATWSSTEVKDQITPLHVERQDRQERCCIHEIIVEEPQRVLPGKHQFP